MSIVYMPSLAAMPFWSNHELGAISSSLGLSDIADPALLDVAVEVQLV